MVTVKKENGKILISMSKKDDITGFVEFLATCLCRYPGHTHEQILQGIIDVTGEYERFKKPLTTRQREKLRFAGVREVD